MTQPSNGNSQPAAEQSFFDLHTTGLGYLRRVRDFKPKPGQRGKGFLACSLSAITGPRDNVAYVPYDLIVSATEAQRVIREYEATANDPNHKVLCGFTIGDTRINEFVYESGDKAGTHGVNLKGHLLFINWVKVDGVRVYSAPPRVAKDNGGVEAPARSPTASEPQASNGVDQTPQAAGSPQGVEAQAKESSLAAYI